MKRIVIIGGGAAGLELATRLGDIFVGSFLAEVILVDQNLSYIWKPLWHEVAAGRVDVTKERTEYLAHSDEHNFKFKLGSLIGIDRQQKLVYLSILLDKQALFEKESLSYDILILALASVYNDFGISGVKKFCLSFNSINECSAFHDMLIIELFKLIPVNKKELSVSIIGGGSTGVELAFEINSTFTELLKHRDIFNNIRVKINIIESSPNILSGLPPKVIKDISQLLDFAGINVYSKEKVIKVDHEAIYTESGKQIKSQIKLWSAGIKAPDILVDLGLETNKKNQLLLDDTLQVTKDEYIFAIGDCANFLDKEKKLPATAQLAHQEAKFLANSLAMYINSGVALKKFIFNSYGTIISAGEEKAVGEIETNITGEIKLNKKFAYFSYRFLYRKYQASLYGWGKTIILIIIDFLIRKVKPSIKLH